MDSLSVQDPSPPSVSPLPSPPSEQQRMISAETLRPGDIAWRYGHRDKVLSLSTYTYSTSIRWESGNVSFVPRASLFSLIRRENSLARRILNAVS